MRKIIALSAVALLALVLAIVAIGGAQQYAAQEGVPDTPAAQR